MRELSWGEGALGTIFMAPQDAIAANSIFADDLWPSGLYSWQDASQSRNLTGSGVRASIFEADESTGGLAGILTTHGEFNGGRAVQVDSAPPSNHATAVADVIIGGGIVDVYQGSTNQGKLLRGIAYAGEVRGHNLNDFVSETGNAVLDGQGFSNHSYGVSGGWSRTIFGGTEWWLWTAGTYFEDPRLGLYSPSASSISFYARMPFPRPVPWRIIPAVIGNIDLQASGAAATIATNKLKAIRDINA